MRAHYDAAAERDSLSVKGDELAKHCTVLARAGDVVTVEVAVHEEPKRHQRRLDAHSHAMKAARERQPISSLIVAADRQPPGWPLMPYYVVYQRGGDYHMLLIAERLTV